MTIHVVTNIRTGRPVHVALTGQAAEQWVRDNIGGPWHVAEYAAEPVPTPRSEMPVRVARR